MEKTQEKDLMTFRVVQENVQAPPDNPTMNLTIRQTLFVDLKLPVRLLAPQIFFFKILIFIYLRESESKSKRARERESERERAEREGGVDSLPSREPNAGLNPRTLGPG